jgi:carbamoyl-phosphate synthase / aspartate carbamoyltransferase / dihydroorotase
LSNPTDKRVFILATALHQGYSIEKLFDLTKIDRWFLHKFARIIQFFSQRADSSILNDRNWLLEAKKLGFCDKQIGNYCDTIELDVRAARQRFGIRPFVKQIDTVSGEWPAQTNYLYLTYHANENDVQPSANEQTPVLVLGSGVYRIGSFDMNTLLCKTFTWLVSFRKQCGIRLVCGSLLERITTVGPLHFEYVVADLLSQTVEYGRGSIF